MAPPLAQSLASPTHRSEEMRLESLKGRTLLVCVLAVLCAIIGAPIVINNLAKLVVWSYALAMHQSALPLAHAPLGTHADHVYFMLQATYLLVCGIATLGFSIGTFGNRSARVVFIPLLLFGAATIFFLPASSNWMLIVPSKVERGIMHNNFDRVDDALTGAPGQVVHYVQAQIALRAHDDAALRKHGEAVLTLVDQWAYGMQPPDTGRQADETRNIAERFRPEVIYALDLALNGQPETQVGIQWQQEQAAHGLLGRLFDLILWPLSGLGLVAAAIALFALWNSMRRRIRIIQASLLGQGEAAMLAAERNAMQARATKPTAAKTATTTATQKPASAPADATKEEADANAETDAADAILPFIAMEEIPPPFWRRHARYAILAPVLLAVLVYGVNARRKGLTVSSDIGSSIGPRCAFVGVWTAARDKSVYQVTLDESGAFEAEPISRGANSPGIIIGKWKINGDKMEWEYTDRRLAGDSNKIRDATANSFTLVEVNGALTRYNLIESTKTPNCQN